MHDSTCQTLRTRAGFSVGGLRWNYLQSGNWQPECTVAKGAACEAPGATKARVRRLPLVAVMREYLSMLFGYFRVPWQQLETAICYGIVAATHYFGH